MAYYRKKPVIIEAEHLVWDNWDAICRLVNPGKLTDGKPEATYLDENWQPTTDSSLQRLGLLIPTLEGVMIAREGDWIIKGVKGELYACKMDIFELTYEEEPIREKGVAMIIAQATIEPEDIGLPTGEIVKGHRIVGFQHIFADPLITDKPLVLVVYLMEEST